MKKKKTDAAEKSEDLISVIAAVEYFASDKTAKEAIDYFKEKLKVDDIYVNHIVNLLFFAELLKGKKTAENRADQITICDEIIKTATELKNFDGLDITGVFS